MDAIVRAENAKEQVRRLEQQLQEVHSRYDIKEIELRMAHEEIINLKVCMRFLVYVLCDSILHDGIKC